MYKTKYKRPAHFDFDLLVIGSGSGGGVAAHLAAQAGKKVAVVEDHKVGGECPNFGCVPTKALLQAAQTYMTAKEGERFGIKAKDLSFDYKTIKAWKDAAVKHTGADEGEAFFSNEHVKVFHGRAHFISNWTVSISGRRYTAKKFLIATGTHTVTPPIPGLEDSGYMTHREAINVTKLPKSLFVIGGGAIGCEFTHLFSALGSKVTVADRGPRLIALEDPEVGELLQAVFSKRGVDVLTNVSVSRVSKKGDKKIVSYEANGTTHHVTVDEILVASGKAPNTDLGLENAGVGYGRQGIKTNRHMQTSNKNIYAAGDVVGPYRFTHTASYQSRVAVHNMFHRDEKIRVAYHAIPRCVFTDPEVACVGATEQQLKDKGLKYQVGAVPITTIGRANTSGQSFGFVKVLANKRGKLLGACIVSPRAGEMVHELTLAIQHGMTARDITETIHAFPTWSEAVRKACQKIISR